MERNYSSFIKFGEKEHMEKLFYEGEVFCRPIDYFSTINDKDFRGDKNDGISHLMQIRNLKISHQGNIITTANNGQIYGRNPNDKGNIYCLFGLASETLNWESKASQKLILNLDSLGFGDIVIWIFDPGEFIERVKKAVLKEGFQIDISPIVYLDFETYEGELSPFIKSKKHEPQSEVRFWIPNAMNVDQTFKIGNISDISKLLSRDMLDKLEYEIE